VEDFELREKEFRVFRNAQNLQYDLIKQKWNKEFHDDTDDNGKFLRWKLGPRHRPVCKYCGKILKGRQQKFCKDQHRKFLNKITKDAMKKFGLKKFHPLTDDPTKHLNWAVMIPAIYEYSRAHDGILRETQIKERVERKDIAVWINGKKHKLTKKSRT